VITLNFKKLIAKNIFCFGEKGITIDFDSFGNIVLIRGRNLDTTSDESDSKLSSNGSGKSSIPELIVYALYGQTIKNPKKTTHRDIMHHKATKGLHVEIYFDDYKLVRTRKPDSLRLWKSANGVWDESAELTLGGMPATQAYLEEQILGLNYKTFVNIVAFTDDNSVSFLEGDAKDKRELIENLLSLEKYRLCHKNAKVMHKEVKDKIKAVDIEISYLERAVVDCENNIKNLQQNQKNWKIKKIEEIRTIGNQVQSTLVLIEEADKDPALQQYEEVQNKIKIAKQALEKQGLKLEKHVDSKKSLENEIDDLRQSQTGINTQSNDKNLQLRNLKNDMAAIHSTLKKINALEPGVVCDHCFGEIKPENYASMKEQHQKQWDVMEPNYKQLKSEIDELDLKIKEISGNIASKNNELTSVKNEISIIEVTNKKLRDGISKGEAMKMPDVSLKKAGYQSKINILNESVEKLKNELAGFTPYDNLLSDTNLKLMESKTNLETKQTDRNALAEEESMIDFWVTAFGDTGIRKYVLDEIIPALNENVNYWLDLLIESKLQIAFDNELNETIVKYPDVDKPINYFLLSNGQRRRINLALSQAFAHVMTLNTGRTPSIMFLDEVTSNIDPLGVSCIYNMICEIAREKKVFVTTHDQELLEQLNGCAELKLVMKDGVSFLE
jgi:exonuclease SbcC